MTRVLLTLATLAVAVAALAATGFASSGTQVVKVSTFPWPEGPGPVVAAAKPMPGIYVPLRKIERFIPTTLPTNPRQSCNYGAKVQLTLRSGRVLTYGPCKRPASIERLRLALIKASRTHG
jgi:hypothetical protein